jgi:hypothetical protein
VVRSSTRVSRKTKKHYAAALSASAAIEEGTALGYLKTFKEWPALLPPKWQMVWKELSPNKL